MKRAARFAIGLVLLHAPLAVAQTTAAHPVAAPTHAKSATTARLLGIVPGVGHMYAGEPWHGVLYLGGVAALTTLAAGIAVTQCLDDALATGNCGSGSNTASNAVAIGALGLWGWSIYDAGRAARRTNARSIAKQTSLIVAPGKSVGRGESVGRTLRLGIRTGI